MLQGWKHDCITRKVVCGWIKARVGFFLSFDLDGRKERVRIYSIWIPR